MNQTKITHESSETKNTTGIYLHQYHSSELKTRILYICLSLILSFIICFTQIEYLLYKVTSILLKIMPSLASASDTLGEPIHEALSGFIFTELLEGFWSSLLLSGYGAFILTLPIIYYHAYKFLLPGLTYIEARFLKTFIILSLAFLILAHLLTYFIIIPYAASFFLSFQSNYPQSGFLSFTGRIYPALSFILNCFTLITFLFQLPLLLFFCFIYFNLNSNFTYESLTTSSFTTSKSEGPQLQSNKNYTFLRKILFFSLVLLTAIFSPPDIYSQLFLFIPLFLILESFILMIFVFKESPYSTTSRNKIPPL